MTMTARTYRTAATEGASHLDLLLATYDVLAEDIRLAGHASTVGNIVERCRLSGHAALLLGHLESWVTLLSEPALEAGMTNFYTYVRAELMRLQADSGGSGFEELGLQVSTVRAEWQQKGIGLRPATHASNAATAVPPPQTLRNEAASRSWSA